MIYQCYFRKDQPLFGEEPYESFGLEPEVNESLFSNCPEPIMARLLQLPETSVAMEKQGDTMSLVNTGDYYVLGLLIKGAGELLSDNYLTLAPGETRIISGLTQGKPSLTGWNLKRGAATEY